MMSVDVLQVCLRRESEVERGVALPCPGQGGKEDGRWMERERRTAGGRAGMPGCCDEGTRSRVPGQRTGPFPGAPGAHGGRAGQGRQLQAGDSRGTQNTKYLVVAWTQPTLPLEAFCCNRLRTIQNRASCPPRTHHLCTTIQSKSTNVDTVDRAWRFQNSGTLAEPSFFFVACRKLYRQRQRQAKCLPRCQSDVYPLTYYARPREHFEDRPDPLVMVINLIVSLGSLPVPSKRWAEDERYVTIASDGVLDIITVIKRSVLHCTRKIPQDRRRILTPAGSAGCTAPPCVPLSLISPRRTIDNFSYYSSWEFLIVVRSQRSSFLHSFFLRKKTGVVDVMMETCTMGTSPRQWAIRRVQLGYLRTSTKTWASTVEVGSWSAFGHHNVLSACVTDYKHSYLGTCTFHSR
ncbi:hypothetical protein NEUTE1DRAFT_110006 [Neurospora tetrasperma FGSC 2508]|uniref:Uncharacterized protein n=1 Tax=Neurospora tetrasperma (strain FGSC 2508 / ATCC MYA-4615 / P0657) TaxID=510951 RepID=F8MME7_NEUT8|nr:uncharacterized protein NEUTE1DRAFT_110006 [Neurospora tetrasperma FGSC 2508]EGO57821.1 hypothetical protein NEUTE1DRAFT_110006 [Neurospora tetrasperma FGSC 2508]